jgi:hypothetical protein
VALTKTERERRLALVQQEMRRARNRTVRVTVQYGRRRPRFEGVVREVATSGAFALLDDGGEFPLHVPLDRVRKVEVL